MAEEEWPWWRAAIFWVVFLVVLVFMLVLLTPSSGAWPDDTLFDKFRLYVLVAIDLTVAFLTAYAVHRVTGGN